MAEFILKPVMIHAIQLIDYRPTSVKEVLKFIGKKVETNSAGAFEQLNLLCEKAKEDEGLQVDGLKIKETDWIVTTDETTYTVYNKDDFKSLFEKYKR